MAALNNYTVRSFLTSSGRRREDHGLKAPTGCHVDHVVELQVVVAAVNALPSTTYRKPGWQTELVDFFNEPQNLAGLSASQNLAKGSAVSRFLNRTHTWYDSEYINLVRSKWAILRETLIQKNKFLKFVDEMDSMLQI